MKNTRVKNVTVQPITYSVANKTTPVKLVNIRRNTVIPPEPLHAKQMLQTNTMALPTKVPNPYKYTFSHFRNYPVVPKNGGTQRTKRRR